MAAFSLWLSLLSTRLKLSLLSVQSTAGHSQMQLQKSLKQYQKIPKSVKVQHKIEMPWQML